MKYLLLKINILIIYITTINRKSN